MYMPEGISDTSIRPFPLVSKVLTCFSERVNKKHLKGLLILRLRLIVLLAGFGKIFIPDDEG